MKHVGPSAEFWTDQKLDELEEIGDEEAKNLIDAYFKFLGTSAEGVMADSFMPHKMMTADECPEIRDYMEARGETDYPDWVDPEKIENTQRLFQKIAPALLFGILCITFPAGYAGGKPTRVLTFTARLSSADPDMPKRRILETMVLVMDCFKMGGLEPPSSDGSNKGGPGWHAARKVRMVHTLVRQVILANRLAPHSLDGRPVWPDGWGVPVSQYQYLGFLETVALSPLDYLDHMGVLLTDEQKNDYLHTWSYIGYLCGVQSDLLPMTLESSEALFAKVRKREYKRSPDGIEMMRIHSDFAKSLCPIGFKGLPQTVQRAVLHEDICDSLKIGPANWTRHLLGPIRSMNRSMFWLERHSKLFAVVFAWVVRKSILKFIKISRPAREGEKPRDFELWDELVDMRDERKRARSLFPKEMKTFRNAKVRASAMAQLTRGRTRAQRRQSALDVALELLDDDGKQQVLAELNRGRGSFRRERPSET